MRDGKTIILHRIREALRENPARPPHTAHGYETQPEPSLPHAQRNWLPKVDTTQQEQISLFAGQSTGLKTEFHRCASLKAAQEIVAQLASEGGWKRIATHTTPETLALLEGTTATILRVDHGYQVDDLENCDAGVTGCECLIAQTGSIMVSGPSAGGRALSVLPPHHIVIARASQMVPDLTAAFELIKQRYGADSPSFLSFITGPSRTGDIERVLVLGAHGPKRLTILLVE
jgi:L-lactate dehydrogenase complex protein LldG